MTKQARYWNVGKETYQEAEKRWKQQEKKKAPVKKVVKRKSRYSPTQFVTQEEYYETLGKLIAEARGLIPPAPASQLEEWDRDTVIEELIRLNELKVLMVKDIAAYVGITTASVSCWLTGVSFPAKRHMQRLYELIKAAREGKGIRTL